MFTVNTQSSRNVRDRRVSEAILLAGTPPGVVRRGATGPVCVSGHAKGVCYNDCARASDHGVLSAKEAVEFHAWCQVAYTAEPVTRLGPIPAPGNSSTRLRYHNKSFKVFHDCPP
jgi:hypothetical protein